MPKRSLSAGQNPRGWVKGFEPLVFGTTIRRFNQLSYTHHIQFISTEHFGSGESGRALKDSNLWLTA